MGRIDVFVSVVAVLHDDAAAVAPFVAEVHALLEATYANYELVLIDNCSQDGTERAVDPLLARYRCVRLIRLSRALGLETAIAAGLESAIGDFVVTMRPDGDPPARIPEMIDLARAGHDIVLGVADTARHRGRLYRFLRRSFYRVAEWMSGGPLVRGATAFRCLSRQAVNALTRVRRRRRPSFILLTGEVGYPLTTFRYEQLWRGSARRDLSAGEALRLGLALLIYSSPHPWRVVSFLGLGGSLLSVLYAIYVIVINLFQESILPGWTTLSLVMSGLFFLVFVMFALTCEYLGWILDETGDRPLYHVHNEKASSVMLTDPARPNVLETSVTESRPEAGVSQEPSR